MAIYEYLCPLCKKVFEIARPMDALETDTKCPTCNVDSSKLFSDFASTHDGKLKIPEQQPFRTP
jgi:putative FmdB family regulatory protein